MVKSKTPFKPAESLAGAIVPAVLPLSPSGEIDFESFRRFLDYVLAGPVDGLWLSGTTGEFFALTHDEGARVVEVAAQQAAGRVPVIAQVGDASTRRAITKAKIARAAGADFLSILLPYYLDYSQVELQRYLTAVSEAVQQPLILYHLPQITKVSLSVPGILELTREGVLLGIKDSSGSVEYYRNLARRMTEEGLSFQMLNGSSMLMDAGLLVGGHGFVCGIANLVPHLCHQLCQCARAGQWTAATALQKRVAELVQALRLPKRTNQASTIGSYKWVLRELNILASDHTFAPFEPFDSSEIRFLQEGALPLAEELCADLLANSRKLPETQLADTGPVPAGNGS